MLISGAPWPPMAPAAPRQHLLHAAARHRTVRGEIRAAQKRGAVGGQEEGERISAQPGEPLHRRLVALGHIGPLVPVNPHRDEQRVDHGPDGRVAVHLAIHHDAPTTVVGADVEEHRPVEPRRECERLTTPGLPTHRLTRGAGEVARGRLGHAVRERPVLRNAGQSEQHERERGRSTHGERRLEDTHRAGGPFRPPSKTAWGVPRARCGRAVPPLSPTVPSQAAHVHFVQLGLPPVIRRKSDLVRLERYIAARATLTDSATTITPKPNGPLRVQGPVRILAPDGTELAVPPRKDGRPAEVVVLCRCGGSATKPFSDGTPKRIGFSEPPPAPPAGPAPTA